MQRRLALLIILNLFIGCVPHSSTSDSAPVAKANDLRPKFQKYTNSLDVNAHTYFPQVHWVLAEAIKPNDVKDGQNYTLIFEDDGAADVQLDQIRGLAFGSAGTVRLKDERTRLEKLGPHSWRIVLNSEFLRDLFAQLNGAMTNPDISVHIRYAVAPTDIPNMFSNILGLKPRTKTPQNGYIALGEIVLPLAGPALNSSNEALTWDRKAAEDIQIVQKKFIDQGRLPGFKRMLIAKSIPAANERHLKFEAIIRVLADDKCAVSATESEDSQILVKVQLNVTCQPFGGKLVIENVGVLSLHPGGTMNGVDQYTLFLLPTIFAEDRWWLNHLDQEIGLSGTLGYAN